MDTEKLEIIIPTWNRDIYLERTLTQFANSPFSNFKITIIDNNSTDKTSNICEKYKKIFPNLNIIKNNKNIGLAANILRCYEIAEAEYMWLVGDNDNWDFSYCTEVIDAIETSEFDLIFIQDHDKTKLKKTTIHELYEKGYATEIIGLMGTISAYIFRTELYTSECIQEGYKIAKYLYPQLAFMKKACEENFTVLISSNNIRLAEKNPHVNYSTLELVTGWITSALILEEKYAKEIVKHNFKGKLLYTILGSIIAAKAYQIENYRGTMNELIISIINLKGLLIGLGYTILMILTSLIPYKIAKIILNQDKKRKGLSLID